MALQWLTTDQHDILHPVHELAVVQGPDRGLVDLTGSKVEASEVLVVRVPTRCRHWSEAHVGGADFM
jgi:hypothetical protein